MEKLLKVLYIGRSTQNIEGLRTHSGVSVIQLSNMQEAVNYLEKNDNPDTVISENYLSGGSGFLMHEWIRARPEFNKVAFILVSFEFKDELFITAFESRIDDYYVLPLPPAISMVGRIEFLIDFRNKNSLKSFESYIKPDDKFKMPPIKRAFDLFVAISALIVLSPLLLLVVIAIRLESKGKVYYISKRYGRVPFNFYKLRSMRVGADMELEKLAKEKNKYNTTLSRKTHIDYSLPCPECAALTNGETCTPIQYIENHAICDYWYNKQKKEIAEANSVYKKILDDPRITKVGKFIRNTSIDELPQLINVIKGDMSIVGNRPLPMVDEASFLTKDTMAKRFNAPAGITGLWQVELRSRKGKMSEEERNKLDNEYSDHFEGNNYSFWYDMKLILRTIPALFQKDTV